MKAVRVELTSESISTGFSPSAAGGLKLRISDRSPAGCHIRYPVIPLCYQELTQSFPVYLTPDFRPTGESELTTRRLAAAAYAAKA